MVTRQTGNWLRLSFRSIVFPIYINDLPQRPISDAKLLAEYTALLSVVSNTNEYWVYNWKMEFNPDLSKQAAFSKKDNPFTLFF